MANILLIDPDVTFCEQLRVKLEREGHDTLIANDGLRGLAFARMNTPDLVMLEVAIPDLDGFSISRILRFESDIPIIMLTACQSEADRIRGLDMGADDYVIKPFLAGELLARIRALLRRGERPVQNMEREVLTAGDLRVDVSRRRVFYGEREVEMVPKEFDILVCLMRNRGVPLSREVLLKHVWGDDFRGEQRTIDVHIRWLRTKIESDPAQPQYIQTVRGFGYRFSEATDERPA